MFVLVGDLQRLHGLDHGLHGGEDVLVDQPSEAPLVLVRVSPAMDDSHLLNESALPTFTGPCAQQTDRQTLVNTAPEKELSRHVTLRQEQRRVSLRTGSGSIFTSTFEIAGNRFRLDTVVK